MQGMSSTYYGAVLGAALGLVLGGVGAGFIALTPFPAAHPKTALALAEVAAIGLGILGAVGGAAFVRMVNRRPTSGPEADYDDPPPPA
jgi:hypothetical protein